MSLCSAAVQESMVFYEPEGVSLRFSTQPEANAFRLIKPNHRRNF
jgi:hypothetical protein